MKRFNKWNTEDIDELARLKLGTVSKRPYFYNTIPAHFTPYYRPLIPWVVKLRDMVFPNNGNWEREDLSLYPRMRQILREGQNDALVIADNKSLLASRAHFLAWKRKAVELLYRILPELEKIVI